MHSIKETYLSLFKNRELIWEMAKRDMKGMNKGAFLGYFWLVLGPLIQVGVYVFIVSFIFGSRLGENSGPFDYAVYVLSGMIPWQIVTRSLQEAPMQLRERMEMIKQVIYPIETLPFTSLIASSMGALVSFLIFFGLNLYSGSLEWSYLLMPIPLALLVLFILGVSWAFSIIGVFFKDLREIVSVGLNLLVYVSPVVATEAMLGAERWQYILLNPLSHIVICFRDIYYAQFHPLSWAVFAAMALAAFLLGGWIITRTKLMINEYI